MTPSHISRLIIHSAVGFLIGSVAMVVFLIVTFSAPPQLAPKPPDLNLIELVTDAARNFALNVVITVMAVAVGGRTGRGRSRFRPSPVTTRRYYR